MFQLFKIFNKQTRETDVTNKELTRKEKYRLTGIERYGSEEAWRAELKRRASLGGTKTHQTGQLAKVGFQSDRKRARTAGIKGGKTRAQQTKRDEKLV